MEDLEALRHSARRVEWAFKALWGATGLHCVAWGAGLVCLLTHLAMEGAPPKALWWQVVVVCWVCMVFVLIGGWVLACGAKERLDEGAERHGWRCWEHLEERMTEALEAAWERSELRAAAKDPRGAGGEEPRRAQAL